LVFVTAGFGQQSKSDSALERALAAFRAGKYEEAQTQIDAAEKINSKQPEVNNLRGAIFTKQKAFDQAEKQYNAALALDPKYYPAKLNLAELELLRGKYAEAKQRYEELQKLDPGSELLQFKLVLCAVMAGEDTNAFVIVNQMKFPGRTPAYYYSQAGIALKAGQKENAQKYFTNVKKYYSEQECAYFAQSLRDLDLTMQTATTPMSTPSTTAR
jgi:Tfp pilus assembly protein PilF